MRFEISRNDQLVSFFVLMFIAYGTAYVCNIRPSIPPVSAIIFKVSFGTRKSNSYLVLQKIVLFLLGFSFGMLLEIVSSRILS